MTRAGVWATLLVLSSCGGVVSRSGVLTFLNAVQRPFDLAGQIWLGVPAPLLAHFIISVSLAGVLAWFWRSKAAGILSGIVILAKEGDDR